MPGAGTVTITYTPAMAARRSSWKWPISAGGGVMMGIYNFNDSIEGFARASLNYGLQRNYRCTQHKNTILKAYDGEFKDIFRSLRDRVQGGVREARTDL